MTLAERTPETFKYAQLLAKDFDGTVAMTFEKPKSGIGVEEAYQEAVLELFDAPTLQKYIDANGLRNRSAPEVIIELAPDATESEQAELTEKLIALKLDTLTRQIGTAALDGGIWPRPSEGYLDLHRRIELARHEGQLVNDLIISSGHEPFIRKTYETWGIQPPDYIIAEEATRELTAIGLPIEQLVKPSPILMDAGYSMWRQDYGLEPTTLLLNPDRDRIVYVGDDPSKDGDLAKNSDVEFVWLDKENPAKSWARVTRRLMLARFGLQHA
jgi:hypothetical protein